MQMRRRLPVQRPPMTQSLLCYQSMIMTSRLLSSSELTTVRVVRMSSLASWVEAPNLSFITCKSTYIESAASLSSLLYIFFITFPHSVIAAMLSLNVATTFRKSTTVWSRGLERVEFKLWYFGCVDALCGSSRSLYPFPAVRTELWYWLLGPLDPL